MGLALTTVAAVKQLRGDTAVDAQITALIAAVSDEAETYMGRWTKSQRRTETYPLRAFQTILSIDGFPIASGGVGILYARTRDFTDATTLESSDYFVLADEGQLEFPEDFSWIEPDGYIQIGYTGGMAADTDAFIASYPRIANAVALEVINRINRAKVPEGNVQSQPGLGMAFQKELTPLKDFYAALDTRRRRRGA